MATIRDVALLANTSIASVSKVLNNKAIRITEEKRREILLAAETLNYVPSRIGAQLKYGKTDMIAIIIPELLNQFYAKLTKNCIRILNSMDKNVTVYDFDNQLQWESRYVSRLYDKSFDGVLMVPSGMLRDDENNARMLGILSKVPGPVVFINKELPSPNFSSVSTEPYVSGQLVGQHLLGLGHERIAYISETPDSLRYSLKLKGLKDTMEKSGVAFDPELVFCERTQYQVSEDVVRRLVSSGATAVFAENDQLAIGLMGAANMAGIRIPDDLSIVGMDDIYIGRIFPTPLTTVRQSVVDLCTNAIDLLMEQIAADCDGIPRTHKNIQLIPELKIRKSTAKPKAASEA